MKVTGPQAVLYCNAYLALEDIPLDNARGFAALDVQEALLPIAQKFQKRQQALQKERRAIIYRHSGDGSGKLDYKNPDEKDEAKKLILFRDEFAAEAEFEVWAAKAEEWDAQEFEVELKLLPANFFEPLKDVPQKIRTGFKPFLVK